MDGWVKNWRKIDENPYLQEYDIAAVFQKMVRMAQREDAEIYCRKAGRHGSHIPLKRGELWMSPRDWVSDKVGYQRIRTIIKTLEKGGLINARTNAAVSAAGSAPTNAAKSGSITIVTICNYNEYQAPEIVSNVDVNAVTNAACNAAQDTSLNAQNQEGIKQEEKKEEENSVLPADGEPKAFPPCSSLPTKAGGNRVYPEPFDHFWDAYPTKNSKSKMLAYEHWVKLANKKHIGAAELWKAAKRYNLELVNSGKSGFPLKAEKWISKEYYLNYLTENYTTQTDDLFSGANGNGSIVPYANGQQHHSAFGSPNGKGMAAAAARCLARRQRAQ